MVWTASVVATGGGFRDREEVIDTRDDILGHFAAISYYPNSDWIGLDTTRASLRSEKDRKNIDMYILLL